MAVATAVLSGAMMVGDSVRQSLRELSLQRLGNIDYAIIATRFFDDSLANRISAAAPDFELAPTAIVVGAASDESSGARTADVQIAAGAWIDVDRNRCVINGELADSLGVKSPGESIVLSVPTDSDAPRDAALDRRSRGDTISGLRVQVSQIVRESGVVSLFNPNGGQRATRNAWVNLADLQEAIDQPGRVNALLAHAHSGNADAAGAKTLNDALAGCVMLEDYGLTRTDVSRETGGDSAAKDPPEEPKTTTPVSPPAQVAIGSRSTYIAPPIVDAAEAVANELSVPLQKIAVNLLTSAKADSTGRVIHYAVIAGVSELDGQPLDTNAMAVNQWTADRLGVKIGDAVTIDFYERGPNGELRDASAAHPLSALSFKVTRILPMNGVGADPTLPPDYKGLTDADSVADWDPPEGLKIDKSLVTKDDEAYWHAYRAAPKIFVSFETAQKLWGGVYGGVTGLRVPAHKADAFCDALRKKIPPASMQLSFRAIKAEQLAAAGGGTDFGEYFLYFSFFLIVAAVLLVAMLFRLGVEQRARQLGLMSAVGFAPGAIRRLALGEGLILAIIGGAIGSLAAVGYTWLIMAGLRTWWFGAVGTTALKLYVKPGTLSIGYVSSIFVAMLAIGWGARRIGPAPVARLLAGNWENETGRPRRTGRLLRIVGIVLVVCGLASLSAAAVERRSADEAFLAGGSLPLCGCLTWLAGALRPRTARPWSRRAGTGGAEPGKSFFGKYPRNLHGLAPRASVNSLLSLGIRNATRHTAPACLPSG